MTLRLNGSTSGYTEIDAPAVAGSNTLVLPTGNGSDGQILGTNGAGSLSWVTAPIGVNQTWQSFNTTQRVAGTTYTNSTGRPIMVNVAVQVNDIGDSSYLVVDGVDVARAHTASSSGANNREVISMSAIVPDGSTYSLTSNGSGRSVWAELR